MNYNEFPQSALDISLSLGAQAARIDYLWMDQTTLQSTDLTLTQLQRSSSSALQMTLWVDGRVGSYCTNRLEETELRAFIARAVANTRLINTDPDRTLPDPSRYYAVRPEATPSLGNYDPSLADLDIECKKSILMAMPQTLLGTDSRIINVTANWNDRIGGRYSIDSQGWEGLQRVSGLEIDCQVACRVPGTDRKPSDDWYEVAWASHNITPQLAAATARNAMRLVLPKLEPDAGPVPAGRYKVLMRPRWVCRVVDPLINAMMGTALYMQRSFFLGKLGERVVSPLLTLTDRPHRLGAMGASWYDFEGVATGDRDLIRDGVLSTWLISTFNGHRLHMEPTIGEVMVLTMSPGSKPVADIVSQAGTFLDITGFLGGNTNDVTGDFSFGVEGLLYRNGEPVQAVSGINITGNLLDLWQHVLAVSSDREEVNDAFLSAVLFDDVSVS